MKFAALPFLLLLPLGASAQQAKPTLAEYLAKHPVAGSLAVGAELKTATGAGTVLDHFGRKAVKIGGITAIVPTEMIRFEDAPKQEPNLYDGLPRDSKVLFLMSTLTPEQWKIAGGKGIGLDNLAGEQRTVFQSLLPKSLRWKQERAVAASPGQKPPAQGSVASADMPRVRLKIEQRLSYLLPLADRENSYTMRDPDQDLQEAKKDVLQRDDSDDRDPSDTFGVEVRKSVPNVLKKGQLDTLEFAGMVSLPPKTTVGEALARIGAASGFEILADVRVRGMSVSFPGGKARAGDLLDALALAVTGTYRKVGDAYLLVADITGAGARKLRFAIWQDEVGQLVAEQEHLWREKLAKSGLVRNAHLDSNDPLQSTDGFQRRMSEAKSGIPEFFPVDELSADQRAYLTRALSFDRQGQFRRDKVGIESNLKYRFILPDGKALHIEGYLGPESMYRPMADRPLRPDPVMPLAMQPEGVSRPLVVSLTSPAAAKTAAELAKTFGFTELWVQADRKETLAAAVAQGLPTRLFVRPWDPGGLRIDPDRTILGDSGRMVLNRMARSSAWAPVARMIRMQSWPRLEPVTVAGDFISPFNLQWPALQAQIIDLAGTQGLAGVVLTDAMPHGYEAQEDGATAGNYMRARNDMWAFGYDEATRLAFFRAKGIDPIDFLSERLPFKVNMSNPFFGRNSGEDMELVVYQWAAFRAKANASALDGLGRALPDLPMLIDIRRSSPTQLPLHAATLRRWRPGNELPRYEGQYLSTKEDGDTLLLSAPTSQMADGLADFINAAKFFGAQKPLPLAVDLTRIPPRQWSEVLSKAFVRK